MKFKIHRGTKEIGGSCVEVWTDNSRILLDFGLPLVERDGSPFDFNKYRKLNTSELVQSGVLPDVHGLFDYTHKPLDGVVISHAHQDHFGLINFIRKDITFHMGEATHSLILINNLFTTSIFAIERINYFTKSVPFQIGDFRITPYWADHSAFDAYMFLVEANGKRIFYTGDFRNHGRKEKSHEWFIRNAPKDIDYLLLEGTTIGREAKTTISEQEIENELAKIFDQPGKINLVYTSGQNIDRLVSVYKACHRSNKLLVMDVYVAKVLTDLSKFASLPFPSDSFKNILVMFPYFTSRKLNKEGNVNVLYEFKKFKVTKEEIAQKAGNIVMIVRPSLQKDLEHIQGIDGGNLIYSLWEGYKNKPDTKRFLDYLKQRNFSIFNIHTSGHADIVALKSLVKALNPKYIVPIHTFYGKEYQSHFTNPVLHLNDGEECIA